jgi:dolichol kinase
MEKGVSTFELNRQFFHLFLGLLIVVLLLYGIIDKKIMLSIIIVGVILSYLSRIMKVPIVHKLLLRFERKEDLKNFPGKGIIFYFIGCYLSLLLFSKDIAMASIMVLALGDSMSHIFGIHFGRTRTFLSGKKFLEGTIAGLMAGFIGALVFLPWKEAFFASLAAMIVETIEIKIGAKQVDDNLVVPIVAGATVWVLRWTSV